MLHYQKVKCLMPQNIVHHQYISHFLVVQHIFHYDKYFKEILHPIFCIHKQLYVQVESNNNINTYLHYHKQVYRGAILLAPLKITFAQVD